MFGQSLAGAQYWMPKLVESFIVRFFYAILERDEHIYLLAAFSRMELLVLGFPGSPRSVSIMENGQQRFLSLVIFLRAICVFV